MRVGARRRQGSDRGSVTVEVAGYTTLMLLALTVGVQVVVWGLAALGARHTANHAAQVARLYNSTAVAGQADAQMMLDSAVGTALRDPHVTVTRTATTVTVTVHGQAVQVVPFVRPPVTVTVSVPVERTH